MARRAAQPTASVALSDFPVVYMSYDEPWADEAWEELLVLRPDAKRVHGVKGLNACHVAAAQAADTPRFLTVDADTRLLPSVIDVRIPKAYLSPNFRLDWQSRNVVNGVVSGNGSLKLWSQGLARGMRSHEAAADDTVSLDADIGSIKPGSSRIVLMPGCHSETDPARTPFHAFRAGFRETSFLAWLLRDMEMRSGSNTAELQQILTIWCTLGTQARLGDWVLYGARLGLWAEQTWQDWDIRVTHDYDWFQRFWEETIRSRIGRGGSFCPVSGMDWNADRLRAEVVALGTALSDVLDIPMADLPPEASRMMTEARGFPAMRALENLDALGRAFQKGRGTSIDIATAEQLFSDAGLLLRPSGLSNLARLHQLELVDAPDQSYAEMLLRRAMALGCAFAPHHLAMHMRKAGKTADEEEILRLIDLSAERGFAPSDADT